MEGTLLAKRLREHREYLGRAASALVSLGGELRLPTEGIAALREELDRFEVVVAVAGEVNRGKSTFLNALLGARVFPRRSTTCTAVLTVLHDGPPRVRVRWRGGRTTESALGTDPHKELEAVVSKKNADAADIEQADVWYPNPFTRDGVLLVDTPGVNDPEAWRERLTIQRLATADAAILLLDATKPLTATERDFLTEHVLGAWGRRVVFVANKADGLTDDDRRKVRERLEQELAAYVPAPDIHLVSALDAVKARDEGDAERLERSGLPTLIAHLDQLLVKQSVEVFAAARRARLRHEAGEFGEHLDRLLEECSRDSKGVLAEIAEAEATLGNRKRAFDSRLQEQQYALEGTIGEARSIARRAGDAANAVLASPQALERALLAYQKSGDDGDVQVRSLVAEAKRAASTMATSALGALFQERWQRARADLQELARLPDAGPTPRLELGPFVRQEDDGTAVLIGIAAGALLGAVTGGIGFAFLGAVGGGLVADQALAAWRANAQRKIAAQLRGAGEQLRGPLEEHIVRAARASGERIVQTSRKQATEAFRAEQARLESRRRAAQDQHGTLEERRRGLLPLRARAAALEEMCR